MFSTLDCTYHPSRLSAVLHCPTCRGHLEPQDSVFTCVGCLREVPLLGQRIPDFLGIDAVATDRILNWPDEFASQASAELDALRGGGRTTPVRAADFQDATLLDSDGHLTPLGHKLTYHLTEYRRQAATDGIKEAFLDRAGLGPNARVLDVGCGAGQTLRLLSPRRPALRVGLDIDGENLALGCRLADDEGQDIDYLAGINKTLPFQDGAFSHVICRGSISYMHQWQTLAEMVRVLEPGGFLYCRAEGPGYDRYRLAGATTMQQTASYLYDYFLGAVFSLTGWQAEPGRFGAGGRAFTTHRRMARFLQRLQCNVVLTGSGPLFHGRTGWIELLAEKRRNTHSM